MAKQRKRGRYIPSPNVWGRWGVATITEESRQRIIDAGYAEHLPGPDERIVKNDKYQVVISPVTADDGHVQLVHLSIRRLDRKPHRDWRDFQRIKNELVDPEAEAVELFPAESRLVDQANQYHLWVFPPGTTLPFGFNEGRQVDYTNAGAALGAKQRPATPPEYIGTPWPQGNGDPGSVIRAERSADSRKRAQR